MTDATTIEEIRARWAATTPGPWFWHGNTDNHQVGLCGRQPGLGVCEVLSTISVGRDPHGRDAADLRSYLREIGYDRASIEEIVEDWATERHSDGDERTDNRLAITDPDYIRHSIEELAVYQVARNQGLPDDTPRDHPQVYRADICDVRAPNARALAAAWGDVHALLAMVDELLATKAQEAAA